MDGYRERKHEKYEQNENAHLSLYKLHYINVRILYFILEALRIFRQSFADKLVVESDLLNAISWISSHRNFPSRFQFYLKLVGSLSSLIQVEFKFVERLVDMFAPFIVTSL